MAINILLLTLLAIIWGSSFILMKKGLAAFAPMEVAMIRLAVTFLITFPFLRSAFKRIRRDQAKWLLMVAVLGSGLPAILFATSISRVDSAVAGIINSMVPLFTLTIGVLFFGVKQKILKYAGVIVGLAGAGMLVFYNSEGSINTDYAYALLAVIATVCYGINTNILKTQFNEIGPLYLISLMYLIIGFPALIYLGVSGVFIETTFDEEVWKALLAVIVLGIFGSVVAMFFFVRLIQRTSALFASTVTYLIPVVAVFWGIFDKESLGMAQILGMLLILSGVYLVNIVRKKPTPPR